MLSEKVLRELREERAVGGGDGEGILDSKGWREGCAAHRREEEI